MANIQITIPDALVPRVQAAFEGTYGYQTEIQNPAHTPGGTEPLTIPNPETSAQFMRRQLRDHVKNVLTGYESGEAQRQKATQVGDEFV